MAVHADLGLRGALLSASPRARTAAAANDSARTRSVVRRRCDAPSRSASSRRVSVDSSGFRNSAVSVGFQVPGGAGASFGRRTTARRAARAACAWAMPRPARRPVRIAGPEKHAVHAVAAVDADAARSARPRRTAPAPPVPADSARAPACRSRRRPCSCASSGRTARHRTAASRSWPAADRRPEAAEVGVDAGGDQPVEPVDARHQRVRPAGPPSSPAPRGSAPCARTSGLSRIGMARPSACSPRPRRARRIPSRAVSSKTAQ